MNKSNYIVAVEIGSSKIKGAIGEVDPTGTLQIRGLEEEHQHPNFVRYGQVQNVKEVATELNRVIAKLNNRISPAKISAVYVGVGGRSLKSTPVRLEETLGGISEVTPEIIDSLLGSARTISPDRDLLAVEPIEYIVDGKSQGLNPVGIMGREVSVQASAVTIRSQIIRNLQLAISEKLGLKINGMVVRPLAVANLVLTDEERRLGVMLVDAGAETTTVAIYKKGALQYLNTIPLGSRHITRDLTTLPCTEERAEETKIAQGNCSPDASRTDSIGEVDTTEVNTIVRMRAGEIVANVTAQMEYAGITAADLPCGIVLVGGGAQLKGFADLLISDTSLPVRRGTIPPTVRAASGKFRPADDIDVVAILSHLTSEKLKPCVVEPEPVKPVVETPKPEVKAEEPEQPDDFEEEEEDEEIETVKPKSEGFFSKIFRGARNMVAPLDETEEDEF